MFVLICQCYSRNHHKCESQWSQEKLSAGRQAAYNKACYRNHILEDEANKLITIYPHKQPLLPHHNPHMHNTGHTLNANAAALAFPVPFAILVLDIALNL